MGRRAIPERIRYDTESLRKMLRDYPKTREPLQRWLEYTAPSEVKERLANLVRANPISPLRGLASGGFAFYAILQPILHPDLAGKPMLAASVWFFLVAGLWGFSYLLSGARSYVGARAALLLAERGDERALERLVELWIYLQPRWGKRTDHSAEAEASLHSLLTARLAENPTELRDPRRTYPALRLLLRRLCFARRRRRAPDFTELQADIAIAALLLLTRSTDPRNRFLLRRLTRLPGKGANRDAVRDLADYLLHPKKSASLAQTSALTAVSAASLVSQSRSS